MLDVIFVSSFIGFWILLVVLLIKIVRKKPVKKTFGAIGVCILMFIITSVLDANPSQELTVPNPDASNSTANPVVEPAPELTSVPASESAEAEISINEYESNIPSDIDDYLSNPESNDEALDDLTAESIDDNNSNLVIELYKELLPLFTNGQLILPSNSEQLLHDNYQLFAPNTLVDKTSNVQNKLDKLAKDGVTWQTLFKSSEPYIYSDNVTKIEATIINVETFDSEDITFSLITAICSESNSVSGMVCTLFYMGDVDFQPEDSICFYGIPIGYYTPEIFDFYFFIVGYIEDN